MKPSTRALAPARDREAARRQKFARRGDKVRRIEDDVKNKRSVFTTVWNWTASPREKWGSPTLCRENDIVCYGGCIARAKTTRQRGGDEPLPSTLAWIYCARDATATWYLLSAGRLPTNAGVIKPRECWHLRARWRSRVIQRHLLRARYYINVCIYIYIYTREKHIVLQLIYFSSQLFFSLHKKRWTYIYYEYAMF